MDLKKEILIYVVEDNKVYNRFVCEHLKKLDYKNVRAFYNGKDCLKQVAKGESPDVVIQDYFLDLLLL